MELAVTKAKRDKTLDKPLTQLNKSLYNLDDIDLNIFKKLTIQDRNELKNKVKQIEEKLEQLKNKLEELE